MVACKKKGKHFQNVLKPQCVLVSCFSVAIRDWFLHLPPHTKIYGCSSSVQFSSVAQLCPTLCDPVNRNMPGLPLHHQHPESTQTHVHELVMPSNHLILCRPLLLLPSVFPSIRVFSNESALHIRWPKYWSFSLNISPANEHPGLICFRMAWLDLLAVQGTLKSLLQHHSSKASILLCSVYTWLIHSAVQQKLTEYCKAPTVFFF